MIEARDLTKRYGDKVAVDHLSFTVQPGRVTGFLGPNGAGKSTTMRLILGLDHPHSGTATIEGKRYADIAQPLRTVGALLEAKAMHPGRSAYNHLLFLAETQGLARSRVDEVLDLVGLRAVGAQANPRLLARHEPAGRHRRSHARQPAGTAAGRAGQRARPRGHPVDQEPDEAPGRRKAGPFSCPAT